MAKIVLRFLVLSVALTLGTAVSLTPKAWAQEARPSEYEVKAAFLFNFAKFIEWPEDSFKDDQSPIRLGILGTDPFGSALDALKDKVVRGRRLRIERSTRIEDLRGCHILFVGSSEKENLKSILKVLRESNVLSVSDVERFAYRGGIIRFIREGNRIQFEINVEAAQRSRLKISSQLLKLARIVSTESVKENE